MPYRAMIWTVVTVGLALMAMAMWISVIAPMMAGVRDIEKRDPASTQLVQTAHTNIVEVPATQFKSLVRAVSFIGFLLICLLLVIGCAASFREWLRYGNKDRALVSRKKKTPYVDAWKIAGDRLEVQPPENPNPDDPSIDEN